MKEKILITSATGKTGFQAATQLLRDGYPVKIFVRSPNNRALELERSGAEIFIGDLADYAQLSMAMRDTKRVYYCHPFVPGLFENTKMFIRCARENNIEAIVNMGQWLAEFEEMRSIHTNDIKASFHEYEQSGLNVIQLIPGFLPTILFL
jgi:nucleoside-diphosphate-sugar epimerase